MNFWSDHIQSAYLKEVGYFQHPHCQTYIVTKVPHCHCSYNFHNKELKRSLKHLTMMLWMNSNYDHQCGNNKGWPQMRC
jgi:hypothetical protein